MPLIAASFIFSGVSKSGSPVASEIIFIPLRVSSCAFAVTASVGEMSCTNDETRYCDENKECYTTEAFNYGQWDVGCRVVPEA